MVRIDEPCETQQPQPFGAVPLENPLMVMAPAEAFEDARDHDHRGDRFAHEEDGVRFETDRGVHEGERQKPAPHRLKDDAAVPPLQDGRAGVDLRERGLERGRALREHADQRLDRHGVCVMR